MPVNRYESAFHSDVNNIIIIIIIMNFHPDR